MSAHPNHVASALAEAARTMNVSSSLEETLDTIVQAVVLAVPELDHAGISLSHRDGRIETMSGTDALVWELDQLQYQLAEGPCVDSIRGETVVLVEHARHDQRWPRYMPQAAARGLRSQLGLQLFTEQETLGGLNLYSTSSDTIDPDAVHLAELFATHAAIALGRVRTEDQLNTAIATRKLIGQAIGIISERYQIPSERAFQFLVRASQQSNVKLREVALEVVESTDAKYSSSGA